MAIPDPGAHPFDVTILKDKSASDLAQVPAAATVKVLEPGATVRLAVTVPVTLSEEDPQPTPVTVYDATTLEHLDFLAVNSASINQLRVAIPPPPPVPGTASQQVSLLNLTATPVSLSPGDRLVRLAAPVPLFKDRALTVAETAPLTTDSAGRARAFLGAARFDYVAEGAGMPARVAADVFGRHSPDWVNARCFPSIQAAVDYAVAHRIDVVYIPAGFYGLNTVPAFVPPLLLPQDRPIRIIGDGPRITRLVNSYGNVLPNPPDVDLVHIRGNYQTIQGLTLNGFIPTLGDPATGAGIRIRRGLPEGGGGHNITYGTRIRDVEIRGVPGWGLLIDDTPVSGDAQIAVWGMYENLELDSEGGSGGILIGSGNTTTQYFHNCAIKNFKTHAVRAKSFAAGLGFTNCIFESEWVAREFVKLESAGNAALVHCHLEGKNVVQGPDFFPYVHIDGGCSNITIESCQFTQKGSTTVDVNNMKAVHVLSGARGINIRNPSIYISGTANLGEGRHIVVEAPPPGGSWDHIQINGGSLGDPITASSIHVYDGSADVPLGPGGRLRMPAFSAGLIDTMANKAVGDLVFNQSAGMAQVWDGLAWRGLQFEPPTRTHLPAYTTAQRDALVDKVAGDAIFNLSTATAQVWDGSAWRDLWSA